MTALSPELTISGLRAWWTWVDEAARESGPMPSGVIVDHGDHTLLVPWVPYPGGPERVFTLDSLLPLTVVERIRCAICGVSGRIESGAWLPLKDGASSW